MIFIILATGVETFIRECTVLTTSLSDLYVQISLIDYVGLILCITAVATASQSTLRVLWGYSDATVKEATVHPIVIEHPHSILNSTPTCSSQIGITQQDYYGRRCGTLLHSYCTGTYTDVTVLLLWSSSNATLEYPRRYSKKVAVWVLHGNSRVITSQKQHGYFNVGTSAVTV